MLQQDYLVIGVLFFVILWYYGARWWRRYKLHHKMYNARRAEKKAVTLLQNHGYNIIDMQKRIRIITRLDNKEFTNWVQADFVVKKRGKLYIVEVKTGKEATKITNSATRRQLLEYYYVYKPEAVLLLDMETQRLQTVEFDLEHSTVATNKIAYLVCLISGIMVGIILSLWIVGGEF